MNYTSSSFVGESQQREYQSLQQCSDQQSLIAVVSFVVPNIPSATSTVLPEWQVRLQDIEKVAGFPLAPRSCSVSITMSPIFPLHNSTS